MAFPHFPPPPVFSKGEKVYDFIRKRYIAATAEEWVRQQLLHYLVEGLGYPKGRIRVEQQLRYLKKNKRVDILVYDADLTPLLLFECKAPHIPIQLDTVEQVGCYGYITQPAFVGMTNGHTWYLFKKNNNAQKWDSVERVPNFKELFKDLT